MDLTILPETAYLFMLMFGRLGTMMMLMPAFGEAFLPPRIRLGFALMFTLIMFPIVSASYPPIPVSLIGVVSALGGEMLVGFIIGGSAQLIRGALAVAGTVIAFQSGLSFAQMTDPTQGQQSAIFTSFMSLLALTLIFSTDLHHMVLAAMVDSYEYFKPGESLMIGDATQMVVNLVSKSFFVGTQMAAPFIVFGLVFYLGLGVLAKLMPQLQVFFIAMPANIAFGLILFMLLLGTMMNWYLNHFETSMSAFLVK